MTRPLCITCARALLPQTSVPRGGSPEYIAQERIKRQDEITEGRVGLYGEARFCTKDCAAFFARACVYMFAHTGFLPDSFDERLQMVGELARRIYPWVAKRGKDVDY